MWTAYCTSAPSQTWNSQCSLPSELFMFILRFQSAKFEFHRSLHLCRWWTVAVPLHMFVHPTIKRLKRTKSSFTDLCCHFRHRQCFLASGTEVGNTGVLQETRETANRLSTYNEFFYLSQSPRFHKYISFAFSTFPNNICRVLHWNVFLVKREICNHLLIFYSDCYEENYCLYNFTWK